MSLSSPFYSLSPDLVIDAVESLGYLSDLRVFALNSYENRVYQVGIEDDAPLIAKFYRPGRWTREQIEEEHQFSLALTQAEVPIVSPLQNQDGQTLYEYQDFLFCLYPRFGGHAPELDNDDTLYTLGTEIGRLHALGKTSRFQYRPSINISSFAIASRDFLLQQNRIPSNLEPAYAAISEQLITQLQESWQRIDFASIRLHGDCHPGNILSRPDSLWLVDLDDARNGPAVQDLWMLISGEPHEQARQMETIVEGYETFCEFDRKELALIEPLRTLRLMHYAAWLAARWDDPAFPQAFPWFNTERYWAAHILELKEQSSALMAPAIQLQGSV